MKYAIVESGGKQYRAVEGGTIEVDRLPVEPGANVKLEQTLLLADGENITVGTPVVRDNPVWTKVLEHFKGEKVTIFNYSPKKRIRVKTGHRQNYTRLFVEQVGGSELKKPVKKAEKVVEAPELESAEAKTAKTSRKTASTSAKAEKKSAAKTPTKSKTAAETKAKRPTTSTAKKTRSTKAEPKKTTTKAASKKPAKNK